MPFQLAKQAEAKTIKAEQETKRTSKKSTSKKITLESMPPKNSKHYQVPFGNYANFVNYSGPTDIKIQPKSPKFVLDVRYFCNFSLVLLGIRPRSRRCAERTRQGKGLWSRPLVAALERSYI